MKVNIRSFLKLAVAVALLTPVIACVNYRKVSLTSVSIGSVSPKGLKSVDGTVKLGIDNGSTEFTVSDIEGTIYRSGVEIGSFSADDLTVKSGSATYSLTGNVSLNGNVSIIEIISIATNFKVDDFSIDLSLKVKAKGGTAQKVSLKDVAVADLIGKLKNS